MLSKILIACVRWSLVWVFVCALGRPAPHPKKLKLQFCNHIVSGRSVGRPSGWATVNVNVTELKWWLAATLTHDITMRDCDCMWWTCDWRRVTGGGNMVGVRVRVEYKYNASGCVKEAGV